MFLHKFFALFVAVLVHLTAEQFTVGGRRPADGIGAGIDSSQYGSLTLTNRKSIRKAREGLFFCQIYRLYFA